MILFFLLGFFSSILAHAELKRYEEVIEKDYPLRSLGSLSVMHPHAQLNIQGWSADKIRIIIKKYIFSESLEEAQMALRQFQYRYRVHANEIEITQQYSPWLSLKDRLASQKFDQINSEWTIFAPSKMRLSVWMVGGQLNLKHWHESVQVRSNTGSLSLETIRSDQVSVMCSDCSLRMKNIRASVLGFLKKGCVQFDKVEGSQVFLETESAQVKLKQVKGDQFYTLNTGALQGRDLKGQIHFQTQKADIECLSVSGSLTAMTETGKIDAAFREWNPHEDGWIESVSGHIQLLFPKDFSALLDVRSLSGKVWMGFPIRRMSNDQLLLKEKSSFWQGEIGSGGKYFQVFSESGDIRILKK